MNRNARTAFNKLKKIGAPVYEGGDYGHFIISAEENRDEMWADYYDGFALEHIDPATGRVRWRHGVNPIITDVLDEHGLYDEWVNPGMLAVYDA